MNRVSLSAFVLDTLEENPEGSSKFVSRPVVGATITIKNRAREEAVTVYATETGGSTITPTTDSNGRINGWLDEGAYAITAAGGHPFIAATTYDWDALSGRGIETGRIGLGSVDFESLVGEVQEALVPTGSCFSFVGTSAPAGYVLMNGALYEVSEQPKLFSVIGYTFGGNKVKEEFAVPDARGRTIISAGAGAGLTTRALAEKAGEEKVQLTVGQLASHTHEQTSVGGSASVSGSVSGTLVGSLPDHNHYPPENRAGWSYLTHALSFESAAPRFLTKDSSGEVEILWGNAGVNQVTGSITSSPTVAISGILSGNMNGSISTSTGTTTETGKGEGHPNMPPWIALNGIIKL